MMQRNFLFPVAMIIVLALLLGACAKKNPPRDEIPVIKNLLARLETAIKEGNAAAIDSLIMAQSYEHGYNSTSILEKIDTYLNGREFFGFGHREFFYTKTEGVVKCAVKADSADAGQAVEIILEKVGESWLVKKFDLK